MIHFWNGNKSPARQRHEIEVLQAVLDATGADEAIKEDRTDYPSAEDEGNIFGTGVDLLVSVAGNEKFAGKDKIVVDLPIAKGLLGKRILVIREDRMAEFSALESADALKALSIGIPATWADASLFRANGYPVVERGSFEEVFSRLKEGQFDYVALGANEVGEALQTMGKPVGGLIIEPTILIRYPMPLNFYVHPSQPALAERVTEGLQLIRDNGMLDKIFHDHYGKIQEGLRLSQRTIINLFNPMLGDWRAV